MRIYVLFYLFFAYQMLAAGDYDRWKHQGTISILTTPEGADLPASALEVNVPVLVRLSKENFDFSQALPDGSDIRFSLLGKALKYSIESWDPAGSGALIWVLIPQIKGDAIQILNMHWGRNPARTESNPEAVFGLTNNYLTVNHMGDSDHDLLKTLKFQVQGSEVVPGLIGQCRKFLPGEMMTTPKDITFFPKGSESHSTSFWYKSAIKGGSILGWGSNSGRGKIVMNFKGPSPHISVDAWFSNANIKTKDGLALNEWTHVVHTYTAEETAIYVNGVLHNKRTGKKGAMEILSKSMVSIGGWTRDSKFEGEIDEVRLSNVARSAAWVKLQYENLRPMHTLVGSLMTTGKMFAVSKKKLTLNEGEETLIEARADGANKVYWSLLVDGKKEVVAVDTLSYKVKAGRVSQDENRQLQFSAVYGRKVREITIPLSIKEKIPDPSFSLIAPTRWDGRTPIEIASQITNMPVLQEMAQAKLSYKWVTADIAVTKKDQGDKLILKRAHNSGPLKIKLILSNGGDSVSQEVQIQVTEPQSDPWVYRTPTPEEMPQDGQFYARNRDNVGLMYCRGNAPERVRTVFLKVYADGQIYQELKQNVQKDSSYSFKVPLKPGLIKYSIALSHTNGGEKNIFYEAKDIVCGDAYLIQGQSNAGATDTKDKSPQETNEWVRSYAMARFYQEGEKQNLWCLPVWKAGREHKAQLGWWGMELGKRLVAKHKVPIFILNGAKGGTRIDQHQRNEANPEDTDTIYGRMLWRLKQAKLTHGIRAVIWHQGENDQGTDGPGGDLGWKNYQSYFVDMAAAWKEDFPNIERYYAFQIYPNACSMGQGNGDMLREKQRTLGRLYANMDVLSTLGVKPPGGCHYPIKGWSVFADMLYPLIARDFYGEITDKVLTPPNLLRAYYSSSAKKQIILEFDQEVIWQDLLVFDIYLDGEASQVTEGKASGNKLVLTLGQPGQAKKITYLKETSWKKERLLLGKNGLAALTFCDVTIEEK